MVQEGWASVSLLDPAAVPGYREHSGPPPDYVPEDLTQWTENKITPIRFGVTKASTGRMEPISAQLCRAMDLVGSAIVVPGVRFFGIDSPRRHLFFTAERTYTVLQAPPTKEPVLLEFQGRIANIAGSRWVDVSANGVFLGRAFRFTGVDGAISNDELTIDTVTWNRDILGSDERDEPADVTFGFVPDASFFQAADWMTITAEYDAKDDVTRNFVNEPVAFQHFGMGLERRADGRFQPVAIIHPVEEDGPGVTRGGAWKIVDDPTDTQWRFWNPRLPLPTVPAEWPELGQAGRFCLVLPFETPDLQECVVPSYPVVCGIPY